MAHSHKSSIASRATSTTTLCSAILPIVYTETSTHLHTLLARHCTYLWTMQDITVTWTICTQTATAFAYSWPFLFHCYSSTFTLHFRLTKEKSETSKFTEKKKPNITGLVMVIYSLQLEIISKYIKVVTK